MKAATIELTSPAFAHGQPIPQRFTGEGEDISPPLRWSGVPEGTKELVIVCDDPDAPTESAWVHWVFYKIPPQVFELPEGIEKKEHPRFPRGAIQGKNSWATGQTIGYRGPMPPPGRGEHRYFFRIYAIKALMTMESGITKEALIEEIIDHIIGYGELMGVYCRQPPTRTGPRTRKPVAAAEPAKVAGGAWSLSSLWQRFRSS